MKAFISLSFLIICFALATCDARAQTMNSTLIGSANKIVYSTNAVEVQDSVKKTSYSFKKGTVIVQNVGVSTGAFVKLLEAHTLRPIYAGPVSALRIVGVTNSDSLKVVSLKTVPY